MIDFNATPLTALETRVLGVLVEKQYTTPDAYPLTLNAIVTGCNQKTSRHPVMNVTEAELVPVMESLKYRSLVIETYGASGRVLRYAHNLAKVLGIGQSMLALLATLMLRGPLTPGELRTNADRLYHFADVSSVEAYLEDMIPRATVPLVVKLAKQPGSREHRWAQVLSGQEGLEAAGPESESDHRSAYTASSSDVSVLTAEVEALRTEVAALKSRLEALEQALGA